MRGSAGRPHSSRVRRAFLCADDETLWDDNQAAPKDDEGGDIFGGIASRAACWTVASNTGIEGADDIASSSDDGESRCLGGMASQRAC